MTKRYILDPYYQQLYITTTKSDKVLREELKKCGVPKCHLDNAIEHLKDPGSIARTCCLEGRVLFVRYYFRQESDIAALASVCAHEAVQNSI